MKTKAAIILFFLHMGSFVYPQSNGPSAVQLEQMPQESVYVHHNVSFLFSGESLKYKFYCFNDANGKLSSISKIGYVSLIDRDGSSVFNHKIILKSGMGYSDFFIPTSVPTGSYKLLGYTDWMRNEGIASFFKSDVYIVNPYQKLPETVIDRSMDSVVQLDSTVVRKDIIPVAPKDRGDFLQLSLDKSNIGRRQEIKVSISAMNEDAAKGNYSLSVRKVNSFVLPQKTSSEVDSTNLIDKIFFDDFTKSGETKSNRKKGKVRLPEFRGELISGNIRNKDTDEPVKNQRISLSLPGDKYLHKIAVSDNHGNFYFNFDEQYDNTSAVLQVLSEDWNQFEIRINEHKIAYTDLPFNDFVISEKMKHHIIERSIQNQIENAYQEAKADSVQIAKHPIPFYRKFTTVYNLDDFTRFNGIPETIVEVVDNVATRKLSNGDRAFEVRPDIGVTNDDLLPMVFVDGLYIKRHQDIMGYSAKKIKTISFSRGIYLLGAQTFQGVLHFSTFEGNFYEDFYTPHITKVDLFKPQSAKQYYNQTYEKGLAQEVIPDFRYQLLWLPSIDLSDSNTEISFFSSDVKGDFEVVLDGFDLNGKPLTITKRISVQ